MTDQNTIIRKVPQVQAMLDPAELTEARTRDLTEGSNAVVAFWEAAVLDARFSQPHESPMRRCILAALSVRDILHRNGRTDAAVAKYGFLLRRFSSDPMREVVTGDRTAPVLANAWNAHMVVRLGDVVLDPTYGQFQRDWNRAPDTFACLTSSPEDCKRASVRLGRDVKAYRYVGYVSMTLRSSGGVKATARVGLWPRRNPHLRYPRTPRRFRVEADSATENQAQDHRRQCDP